MIYENQNFICQHWRLLEPKLTTLKTSEGKNHLSSLLYEQHFRVTI